MVRDSIEAKTRNYNKGYGFLLSGRNYQQIRQTITGYC